MADRGDFQHVLPYLSAQFLPIGLAQMRFCLVSCTSYSDAPAFAGWQSTGYIAM
jgi:hypothetical protein